MNVCLVLLISLIATYFSIGFAQSAIPKIPILSTRKHCGSQRFLNDIRCGCFFASQDPTVTFTSELKKECESIGEGTIASFKSSCDIYLNRKGPYPGTKIRRRAVLRRLSILKEKCIRIRNFTFSPGSDFFIRDIRPLTNLLNNISALYGQTPVVLP